MKTEIPRILPTREEIAAIGQSDVYVAAALQLFRSGRIGYEDALRLAVFTLSEAYRKLVDAACDRAARQTSLRLELPPDAELPPAIAEQLRPRPSRRLFARVAIAGGLVGFGLGFVAAAFLIQRAGT